jgi:protein SCO1
MISKGLNTALMFAALLSSAAWSYNPHEVTLRAGETPRQLEGIGINEKLGQQIDLTTPFISDDGQSVTLARYFTGLKPVLLTIVYYNCASLCNFHLNGVNDALKQLKWTVGDQFDLVAISMDPREGAELAAAKKASYINAYGRVESAKGWHFLTGTEANIKKIAEQIGFNYRWDESSQQFAHASAAVIVTPTGQISRYLHGISPAAKDMRLALIEASSGKVGSIVDRFIMLCFQFDASKSKYTLAAWNIMRIGVVLTVILMAVFLVPTWLRERRKQSLV